VAKQQFLWAFFIFKREKSEGATGKNLYEIVLNKEIGMFSMRKLSTVLTLLFSILVMGVAAFAQTSKGIIAGTVRDTTGAVMSGATVTAKNIATGESRTTTTSEVGNYRIEAVEPGSYQIKVTAANFKTTTIDKLEVKGSMITTLNADLAVGQASETIEVEAKSIEIATENGQLSHSISTVEVQQIPIFNLNAISLVMTQPGVIDVGANSFSNGTGFSVNGSRPALTTSCWTGRTTMTIRFKARRSSPPTRKRCRK